MRQFICCFPAPSSVRRGVLVLEWAYVPVIELLMRAMIVAVPLRYGTAHERARTISLLVVRVAHERLL